MKHVALTFYSRDIGRVEVALTVPETPTIVGRYCTSTTPSLAEPPKAHHYTLLYQFDLE